MTFPSFHILPAIFWRGLIFHGGDGVDPEEVLQLAMETEETSDTWLKDSAKRNGVFTNNEVWLEPAKMQI